MVTAQPHFLLISGADSAHSSCGRWRFLLESIDGATLVEATDEEPGIEGERLELLAVVRGLEALDQPSRVTLVTSSRQVSRGIRYALDEWRQNGWRWERDGRWFPIKNRDLWQRVDRALKYHRVECRTWRFDATHAAAQPVAVATSSNSPQRERAVSTPVAPRTFWGMVTQRVVAASQALWVGSAAGDWSNASSLST